MNEHIIPVKSVELSGAWAYPRVSVLVPVYNEAEYLYECLASIVANDYRGTFELIVIDGNSTDESADIVREFSKTRRNVRVLNNPARKIPVALNLGLANATGEVILRMDAHAIYDVSYISECVRLLRETGAANVGGIWRPVGRTFTSRAIALAMKSRFALGDSRHYYTKDQEYVESVSLGAWLKATLDSIGGFDEECGSNEDYEMNYRLREKGFKILVSPLLGFTYFAPSSIKQLFKKFFNRGMWKVRCLKKHPRSLRWRQLAPPALVLSTASAILMFPLTSSPALSLALLYGGATLSVSVVIASRTHLSYLVPLPAAFSSIHFGWGLGFCWGMLKFGIPRFKFFASPVWLSKIMR